MTEDRKAAPERREAVWLGELIRSRRRGRFSLEALAKRAGISSGLLSEIERGKGNPSYFTLLKLAEALGMDPAEFFRFNAETGDGRVVRAAARQLNLLPDGHYVEFLSPRLDLPTVMWKFVHPPGNDYRDKPYHLVAEIALVVIRGKILIRIQNRRDLPPEDILLEEGDAIRVEAGVDYGVCNPGDEDAEVIAASSSVPVSLSHLSLIWAADPDVL
jgi:transcriptional regulator with XRE-family HTH domain